MPVEVGITVTDVDEGLNGSDKSVGRPLVTPVCVVAGFLAVLCIGCEEGAEAGDEGFFEAGAVGATNMVVSGAMTRYSVVVTTMVFCPLPMLVGAGAVTVIVVAGSVTVLKVFWSLPGTSLPGPPGVFEMIGARTAVDDGDVEVLAEGI